MMQNNPERERNPMMMRMIKRVRVEGFQSLIIIEKHTPFLIVALFRALLDRFLGFSGSPFRLFFPEEGVISFLPKKKKEKGRTRAVVERRIAGKRRY